MKSQLLFIFLPFILLIAFLVGNLALSLVNVAAVGQGFGKRLYFIYVNSAGNYFTKNKLYFEELLVKPYHAIPASLEWSNHIVHIRSQPDALWSSTTLYEVGDETRDNGFDTNLRWMHARTQPIPSANSEYWEEYEFPEWQEECFYPAGIIVYITFSPSNIQYYRRLDAYEYSVVAPTYINPDPLAPPPNGTDIWQWLVNGITIDIPLYNSATRYHTSYNRFTQEWDDHLLNDERLWFPEFYASIVRVLREIEEDVFINEFYYLEKSRADVTTAPSLSPSQPDPAVLLDIWDREDTYVNLPDPRIPTDGTFFTIFNSPLSNPNTVIGIRYDRLLATVPLAFPPARRESPFGNGVIDFEVILTVGQGVTIMNSSCRYPMPNGSNAAGQFLFGEENLQDRRWQIVRIINP